MLIYHLYAPRYNIRMTQDCSNTISLLKLFGQVEIYIVYVVYTVLVIKMVRKNLGWVRDTLYSNVSTECLLQRVSDKHGENSCLYSLVVDHLIAVDGCIHFTVQQVMENMLPFLDTVVHRVGNIVKFSVYRKPINKDD